MQTLSATQLNKKLQFIDAYVHAANPADGSKLDANANVTQKTSPRLKRNWWKIVLSRSTAH